MESPERDAKTCGTLVYEKMAFHSRGGKDDQFGIIHRSRRYANAVQNSQQLLHCLRLPMVLLNW